MEKNGKAKFIWSIILFVLALLVMGIAIKYLYYDHDTFYGLLFLIGALVGMGISCYLVWLYRREHEKPSVFSLILFIITLIPACVIFVFCWFFISFLREHKEYAASTRKKQIWTVTQNGQDYILEETGGQSYVDDKWCKHYRDNSGSTWYSDDGEHFFRK